MSLISLRWDGEGESAHSVTPLFPLLVRVMSDSARKSRGEEGVASGANSERTLRLTNYRAEKKSSQNIFKQDPGRARQSS